MKVTEMKEQQGVTQHQQRGMDPTASAATVATADAVVRASPHAPAEEGEPLEESEPVWKRLAPAVGLAVVGTGSFFLAFRRSMRKAKTLNRDLLDAAKKSGDIPGEPEDLARKALGYATALVAAFGITLVGATSVILDVRSVPEFADKMRSKVRWFGSGAGQYVQAVTDKYMTNKPATPEEEEFIREVGLSQSEAAPAQQQQQQQQQQQVEHAGTSRESN